MDNLKSAKAFPAVVREKLAMEVAAGRVAGPFDFWPFQDLMVSPVGVVPKKTPGEFRMIHHLSWPEGASVNDFISREDARVQFASVDSAMFLLREFGLGAELAKCDIQSAFRLLPVHPLNFSLLGIQFDELLFVDKVLPMGCSVSRKLFETFSTFLQWLFVIKSGYKGVLHYLDDFLFVGHAGTWRVCEGIGLF